MPIYHVLADDPVIRTHLRSDMMTNSLIEIYIVTYIDDVREVLVKSTVRVGPVTRIYY
jgi:hypothetical protein